MTAATSGLPYVLNPSGQPIGSVHYRITDAETAAGVTIVDYSKKPGNVLRYDSNTTPGTTDMTAAIQAAIDSTADGNGTVSIPAGTYLISSSLLVRNRTWIIGEGMFNSIIKVADDTNDAALRFETTGLDYVGVRLAHFQVNGNKANQTDTTNSRGIYLSNAGGTSNTKAAHRIDNLYIRSCLGDGLYMGAYMRSSVVHDVKIYQAGGYGLRLATFSDSQVYNMDIGQSGLDGVYVTGTGAVHLAHIKSWFSEDRNYYFRNSGIIGTGLESQEAGKQGFYLENTDDTVRCFELAACWSDADNRSDGGYSAVALIGMDGGNIQMSVTNAAAETTYPLNAMSIDGGTSGVNIDLRIDRAEVSNRAISGAGIGNNSIRLNGRDMEVTKHIDDFTGYALSNYWGTQTGTDGAAAVAIDNTAVQGTVILTTGQDAAATMAANGVLIDSGLSWRANAYGLTMEVRLKVDSVANVALYFGFTDQNSALEMPFTLGGSDALTSNASNGVGVLYDTAADTDDWWLVGVDGDSDATKQDVGDAPDANTYETWVILLSNTGNAEFYRDGAYVGSQMTDAVDPTASLTPVVAAFSRTNASKVVTVDFIRVQQMKNDLPVGP